MTGIDIVKIERIKNILEKNSSGFYRRIFTQGEIEYIKNKDEKTVAGLYAAKEAVSKLVGTGIGQLSFKDIEIYHEDKGKPRVKVLGKLGDMLKALDIDEVDLSISHEDEYAIAIAVGTKAMNFMEVSEDFKGLLPNRKLNTHKGTYGRVGVIAGSPGMTGAPYLASMAALRSGAGLVYNIVPSRIADIMSIKHIEVIVRSYDENEECLSHLKDLDGIVLGPGLGVSEEKRDLVKNILKSFRGPIVLDADGINLIDDVDILRSRKDITVITPHPGELARLLGKKTEEIQRDRIYYSKYTSEKYNVISILKGHETVVAYKDRLFINKSGNPGMATAGSGDVLTGMIISIILQKEDIFDASAIGVYSHGLAGDIAKYHKGEYGLIAGDILDSIPTALRLIQNQR
ncbi:NAD(P)H-hydrate dehydratase [Tissierella creatinini]|nr:NAD(P)H-hydrate dehydratase [Tissierella creatinini]TJX67416.1 NAD(P)H-hydrate dehydratase [Soehngenia saccharolytica]